MAVEVEGVDTSMAWRLRGWFGVELDGVGTFAAQHFLLRLASALCAPGLRTSHQIAVLAVSKLLRG